MRGLNDSIMSRFDSARRVTQANRVLSGCEQIAGPTRFFAMSPKPTRAQFTFLSAICDLALLYLEQRIASASDCLTAQAM